MSWLAQQFCPVFYLRIVWSTKNWSLVSSFACSRDREVKFMAWAIEETWIAIVLSQLDKKGWLGLTNRMNHYFLTENLSLSKVFSQECLATFIDFRKNKAETILIINICFDLLSFNLTFLTWLPLKAPLLLLENHCFKK